MTYYYVIEFLSMKQISKNHVRSEQIASHSMTFEFRYFRSVVISKSTNVGTGYLKAYIKKELKVYLLTY